MNLEEFWYWVEELPLSLRIGESWLFPLMESLHVIGAVFVLGSLAIADLRLLGWKNTLLPANAVIKESITWTWLAFGVAVITGLAMFVTRAGGYANNSAFLWKMSLLVLAGVNMLYFHARLWPSLAKYNDHPKPPLRYRVTGGVSLSLWLGVMLAGRWIGHIF